MLGVTDPDLQRHLGLQATASCFVGVAGQNLKMQKAAARVAGAMLKELGPRDATEGMLTLHMAAIHNMSMEFLERAGLDGQTLDARKHYVNAGVKMMRLFLEQMQMLRKCRGQGQQQVVVKHVQVNDGGQAIVGHIEAGRKDAQEGRT